MAAGAVISYLALLALAVLSCLQAAVTPAAASQLSQSQPRSRHFPQRPFEASAATTPHVVAGHEHAAADGGAAAALQRTCWYTVKVKTSCASPRRWSDAAVSLAFGDAYRDEVYVARLAPGDGGFERCATDTFRVSGPCGYGVCYLYLRRSAGAGWAPEWVRVYEPTSSTPSTFYYGGELPAGVWYGFNRCLSRTDDAPRRSDDAAVQYM